MAQRAGVLRGPPSRVRPERIAGMKNSYVFDIEGEGRGPSRRGRRALGRRGRRRRGLHDLDDEESFEKIVAGEQNPTTAYMTGKLKIKGDMGAAMKLQKLF